MYRLVRGPQDLLSRWVLEKSGGLFTPGAATAIVLSNEYGRPVAGIAFTDCNGRNVSAHIFIEDPRAAIMLLSLAGAYVFEQLACKRLTLIAEESNLKAVRLHEKLGAIREGRLVGAGKTGDDILVSRLTSESRIWKRLRERRHRKPLPLAA